MVVWVWHWFGHHIFAFRIPPGPCFLMSVWLCPSNWYLESDGFYFSPWSVVRPYRVSSPSSIQRQWFQLWFVKEKIGHMQSSMVKVSGKFTSGLLTNCLSKIPWINFYNIHKETIIFNDAKWMFNILFLISLFFRPVFSMILFS